MNGLILYFKYSLMNIRCKLQYKAWPLYFLGTMITTVIDFLGVRIMFSRFGSLGGWTAAHTPSGFWRRVARLRAGGVAGKRLRCVSVADPYGTVRQDIAAPKVRFSSGDGRAVPVRKRRKGWPWGFSAWPSLRKLWISHGLMTRLPLWRARSPEDFWYMPA